MKYLNNIAKDLFNKIRGRFPSVTIGDSEGVITNVPDDARFFEFDFNSTSKVSVSLDEENGVSVIVGKDILEDQPDDVKTSWYSFLRELRQFAKKRLLSFDVRDINKTNLKKKDYLSLAANRPGEDNMNESKLYGTSKTSFMNIGNARLRLRHSTTINPEIANSRTQHVENIYIESPEGERFKYPFKHLSGAKAMARHVSEGGNAYDDFGKYIVGLSEELSKLRTFKRYMGRSTVMAESLAGYMDVVNERIATVKKTIDKLQKETYYKETFENFESTVLEEVPDEVAENWIDQLTIRQFNEELKDVFPYIYKLVGEATRAKEVTPDDLIDESSCDCNCGESPCKECGKDHHSVEESKGPCWKGYKQVGMKEKAGKQVPNCVPESTAEAAIESAINELMGQFADDAVVVEGAGFGYVRFIERMPNTMNREPYLVAYVGFGNTPNDVKFANAERKQAVNTSQDVDRFIKKLLNDNLLNIKGVTLVDEPVINKYSFVREYFEWASEAGNPRIKVQSKEKIEKPDSDKITVKGNKKDTGNWGNSNARVEPAQPKRTVYFTLENPKVMKFLAKQKPEFMHQYYRPNIKKFVMDEKNFNKLRAMLKDPAYISKFGETLVMIDKARSFQEDGMPTLSMPAQMKPPAPEKPKTPIGEFILSYFDKETGKFPKGPTAVLTAVQKDYGDQYVKPAMEFIKKIEDTALEHQAQEAMDSRYPDTTLIKQLAGL